MVKQFREKDTDFLILINHLVLGNQFKTILALIEVQNLISTILGPKKSSKKFFQESEKRILSKKDPNNFTQIQSTSLSEI